MTAATITAQGFLESLAEVLERPGYDSRLEGSLLRGRTAGVKFNFQGAPMPAAESLGIELPVNRNPEHETAARQAMQSIATAAGLPDPAKKSGWLAHDLNRMKLPKRRLQRIVADAIGGVTA